MVNFTLPIPQLTDQNGSPLSGGRVTFYQPGTTTLAKIWLDFDGVEEAANPLVLGADGVISVFATGDYTLLIERLVSTGVWAEYYSVPLYHADTASAVTSTTGFQVDTIAIMRNIVPAVSAEANVMGYTTSGDGGGGFFKYYANSGFAENGFTIFQSSVAAGQWVRSYTPIITPMMAGAFPNSGLPCDSTLSQIALWSQSSNVWSELFIPNGTWTLSGIANFNSQWLSVRCAAKCFFSAAASAGVNVQCASFNVEGEQRLIGGNSSGTGLNWNPISTSVIPCITWFGAGTDTSSYADIYLTRALNPAYNNSGAVRITTPIAVGTAALDSTSIRIIYEGTGSIQANGGTFKVGHYTVKHSSPVWLGVTDDVVGIGFSFMSDSPSISHFTTGSVSSLLLTSILQSVTAQGTKSGICIVDINVTVTGVANSLPYPVAQSGHFDFRGGVMDCSAGTYSVGNVIAAPYVQCFTSTSINVYTNNDISYPHWFGLNLLSMSTCLQNALNCAPMVDGLGVSFRLNQTLHVPTSLIVGLQNINLNAFSTGMNLFDGSTTASKVTLNNVNIDGKGTYTVHTTFNLTSNQWCVNNLTLDNIVATFTGVGAGSKPYSSGLGITQGGYFTNTRVFASQLNLRQMDNVTFLGGQCDLRDWDAGYTGDIVFRIQPNVNFSSSLTSGVVTGMVFEDWTFGSNYRETGIEATLLSTYNANITTSGTWIKGDGTRVANNKSTRPGGSDGWLSTTEAIVNLNIDDAAHPDNAAYSLALTAPVNLIGYGAHPSKIEVLGTARNDYYSTTYGNVAYLKAWRGKDGVDFATMYGFLDTNGMSGTGGAPYTILTLKVYS